MHLVRSEYNDVLLRIPPAYFHPAYFHPRTSIRMSDVVIDLLIAHREDLSCPRNDCSVRRSQ